MNKDLISFAQKFRLSATFAANKAVEYINANSKKIADLNREQMVEGEDANRKDFG